MERSHLDVRDNDWRTRVIRSDLLFRIGVIVGEELANDREARRPVARYY